MKNKAVVVLTTEISFAGELIGGALINMGILFKPSDKSNIKMWFPIDEIKKIVLPDATEVINDNILNIYLILSNFANEFNLGDV